MLTLLPLAHQRKSSSNKRQEIGAWPIGMYNTSLLGKTFLISCCCNRKRTLIMVCLILWIPVMQWFTLHTWYIILDIHQWLNENGAAWFVNIKLDRTKEADYYKTRNLVTDKHFLKTFLNSYIAHISEMKVLNKLHSLKQYIC